MQGYGGTEKGIVGPGMLVCGSQWAGMQECKSRGGSGGGTAAQAAEGAGDGRRRNVAREVGRGVDLQHLIPARRAGVSKLETPKPLLPCLHLGAFPSRSVQRLSA